MERRDQRRDGPSVRSVRGGEGGIRTHAAFADRFSRAAPSTTRTPLRRGGYQRTCGPPGRRPKGDLARSGGVELLDLVAADPADDTDSATQRGVLGELEERAGGAVGAIRHG